MSFFVKAAIEALQRFPVVNASVDGNDVVYHDYYDIGIAVSTDRGLIVPVLRDADHCRFGEIEAAVVEYANAAREGSIGWRISPAARSRSPMAVFSARCCPRRS